MDVPVVLSFVGGHRQHLSHGVVDALHATVAVGVVGARHDFWHAEELVHGKRVGVSLFETDANLSLASPLPSVRGHLGKRIPLDWSRLRFPKQYGKRQGAPDWSTLTGKARHPSYRRGIISVRPHQMVLSARPGRHTGSVLSDHLVATCQGKGARKLTPRVWLRLIPAGDGCSPPVRWPPAKPL